MAVVYILDQVTSRSPVLMLYLRQLWEKLQQSDISFGKIEYIRSAENPVDAPSRLKGWDEWRLCQALFDKVSADCGPYTVDRFASAHTALLPRYNSMWADPAAEGLVNAFSNDWRGERNWIHPPIDLLDDVCLKLREEPCCATVVAPHWPGRSWHRDLKELCVRMQVLPNAQELADLAFLAKWGVRGPGQWPLALFHLESPH